MSIYTTDVDKELKSFCAEISNNPLLVQGSGGNVSWKNDGILWVKASGTWLAQAETEEIFLPVNLQHLQKALWENDFLIKPQVVVNTTLRPSIETLLHALMPHRLVVHLHAVDILVYLVQVNAKEKIKSLVGNSIKWIYIDYFKPGAELAQAINEELTATPDADVVFMGNHGIVIGGDNVNHVYSILKDLISKLEVSLPKSLSINSPPILEESFIENGYELCEDEELGLLVKRPDLVNRLRYDWALYPDHVVFLGAKAVILEKNFSIAELRKAIDYKQPFIFVCGDNVYQDIRVSQSQKIQLRCYYEIVRRQNVSDKLVKLNNMQVQELINWDAEQYRQQLSTTKEFKS
jgi:rhamnose utilization protein RhaD (predicted bifunctional aldolase and dehydrogenase)